MSENEQPLKTYRGNCHCGAFVFELNVPEIKLASPCNCSLCSKKGYLWTAPGVDGFTVVKGDEKDLKEYTFSSGTVTHKFCSNCSTGVLARSTTLPPAKQLVVNIRAIQGPLDVFTMEKKTFDGSALPPKWEAPAYTGPEPAGGPADGKTYHGSCHCGAVKFALRNKALDTLDPAVHEDRVMECNCSICQRGGQIWIYPKKDQIAYEGAENLARYSMGNKVWNKTFCKTCGVPISNSLKDLTEEMLAAFSPEGRAFMEKNRGTEAINTRTLNDFDFMTLKSGKFDGYNYIKPLYVNP